MRVVFRVDASLEIGSGHVMRCLTLADILRENGANIQFITRKYKGNLIHNIISKGFSVLELEVSDNNKLDNKLFHAHWLGATQKQDATECLSFLKKVRVDWLIVDHYGIDENWQNYLKGNYQQLMVIDDLADRKHQCDILLDQAFGRQKNDYKELVSETCELMVGSQYALLRPEFNNWRQYSLNRRKYPVLKELFINMGGTDTQNITEEVLKEIGNSNLSRNINIIIVMGASSPHLDSVKRRANSLSYNTKVKTEVKNMAEIMANSDIAIGASGGTTWERCCLGLPSIQIVLADNQIFSANFLSSKNIVKLIKDTSEIKELLESAPEWIIDISSSSNGICNGLGVYKVFNKLTNLKIKLEEFGDIELQNYVNLTKEDKMLVLNMRNHIKVKSFMYNQDDISESLHLKFIDNLEGNSDKRYFLVKYHQKVIGSINLYRNNLNHSVEFGLYTNPFEEIKGAGKMLESVITNYAFIELGASKLRLEVFADNARAINFYHKCGFEVNKMKKLHNKDVFCMEKLNPLGRENE